ncbi:MAG: hypothetical protein D6705_15635 [Deltaproteobacteria bacterium]|nr:MAG: hypothetical protein D6705_15635 [Deltaproteobacteria bacterium]
MLSLVLAPAVGGCKQAATIPGTEIPDTPENREVLQTLENYRIAMVQKDPAAVLATVHATYYDHAGTDDPADDLTYDRLAEILRKRMEQIESIRYSIDYLDVSVKDDRAVVRAWIDASFRLRAVAEDEEDAPKVEGLTREKSRYARVQDFNMFELVRDGKTWLITRGI